MRLLLGLIRFLIQIIFSVEYALVSLAILSASRKYQPTIGLEPKDGLVLCGIYAAHI